MAANERFDTSVLASETLLIRPGPGPPSWLLILILLSITMNLAHCVEARIQCASTLPLLVVLQELGPGLECF